VLDVLVERVEDGAIELAGRLAQTAIGWPSDGTVNRSSPPGVRGAAGACAVAAARCPIDAAPLMVTLSAIAAANSPFGMDTF
jgi:hypothetical protein